MNSDIKKTTNKETEWHFLDADGKILGRLANEAAQLLIGKHRVDYAPNKALPVYVVIVNTDKIKLTGNKLEEKMYYRYSGYHGGLKKRSAGEQLQKDSTKVIQAAVSGMLPKNKLRDVRMKQLKLYAGAEHPHTAQVGKN